MVEIYHVIRGKYLDSVLLMQIGREIEKLEGTRKAGCMVATEENLALFRDAGFTLPPGTDSNSILIAVDARDEESGKKAIQHALNLIERREPVAVERHTLDEIANLVSNDDFPLLLVSTAGEYVREIGMKALGIGLNLHIFSSNVSVDDELELKRLGRERGLLVMGPDSGTSIINGKGLGFSNALKGGNDVAVVGSSGTGIQELIVQLDRAGLGVSYAIDVGSKDVTNEVQGIMTKQAIGFLEGKSSMLVIVCKRPDPTLRKEIIETVRDRPSAFVSLGNDDKYAIGKTYATGIIDDAVEHVLQSMGRRTPVENDANNGSSVRGDGRKLLKGYFMGGSLCYQAQAIFFKMGVPVYSNAPLRPEYELHKNFGDKNVCSDTGAEEYVAGRPHPMIDPEARNSLLVGESRRDDVRVLLFDIILGYGSAENPLEGLDEISSGPALVASLCGTDGDLQDRAEVERKLRKMGADVFSSAAKAAAYSAELMRGSR
jgi:FdrA protein